MTKAKQQTTMTVRNPETGEYVTVRGVGSLKDSGLKLKKGIDLTKPIAAQVLREKQK